MIKFCSGIQPNSKYIEKLSSLAKNFSKQLLAQNHLSFDKLKKIHLFWNICLFSFQTFKSNMTKVILGQNCIWFLDGALSDLIFFKSSVNILWTQGLLKSDLPFFSFYREKCSFVSLLDTAFNFWNSPSKISLWILYFFSLLKVSELLENRSIYQKTNRF